MVYEKDFTPFSNAFFAVRGTNNFCPSLTPFAVSGFNKATSSIGTLISLHTENKVPPFLTI